MPSTRPPSVTFVQGYVSRVKKPGSVVTASVGFVEGSIRGADEVVAAWAVDATRGVETEAGAVGPELAMVGAPVPLTCTSGELAVVGAEVAETDVFATLGPPSSVRCVHPNTSRSAIPKKKKPAMSTGTSNPRPRFASGEAPVAYVAALPDGNGGGGCGAGV